MENKFNFNDNQIVCGDCVDFLQEMSPNCIDLTVTSPPYDNLRDYKGFKFEFEEMAYQLYRVTKSGGVLVWVVGDATVNGSESGTSFKQALYFKEIGFNLHDTMIYEKTGFPFPEFNRYYQSFEYMFVFSKGKPKTVNLIKDRMNTYAGGKVARRTGTRMKNGSLVENSANRVDKDRVIKDFGVRFNIWRMVNSAQIGNREALKHPATFPKQLAMDHISTWSTGGDLVLDPMCGSGTTCVAAKQLGRKYLGIDISEEYCNLARNIVADSTVQPSLDL